MADKKLTFSPDIIPAEEMINRPLISDEALSRSFADIEKGRYRNTVGDTAVGLLDTLQSIGSIPLAALPGYGLEDAAKNSQILDQLRSDAYLRQRARSSEYIDKVSREEGELAGAIAAVKETLGGGNLTADAISQAPYLMMGPAARLTAVARAEKATGVLGKVARLTMGTNEAATINRLAAISGVAEGAGGYGQTYERAIAEGLSEEEALSQARLAGAFNTVLGGALGRLTPAFELNPSGLSKRNVSQFLGDAIGPHASAIAGEALLEEGGLALGQTVFDNILAGKDPMEGVGGQVGQAAAISSVFTGGIRTPGAVLDSAKAIGKGVRMGIGALADKAVTPEQAATAAAAAVVAEAEQLVQPGLGIAPDAPAEATSEETPAPVVPETVQESPETPVVRTRTPPEEEEPLPDPVDNSPSAKTLEEYDSLSRPKAVNPAVETVLVNAATANLIENTTGEQQYALLEAEADHAPVVNQAQEAVVEMFHDSVDQYVETMLDEQADLEERRQAQLVVQAVENVDVTLLPETLVPEPVQPLVAEMKKSKEKHASRKDRTSLDILTQGFTGDADVKLGMRGWAQKVYNFAITAKNGDRANGGAANMLRFMVHLEARAKAFEEALAQEGDNVKVKGTRTRGADDKLTREPFVIHKNNAASMAVVQQVFEDVAEARAIYERSVKTFPKMFSFAYPLTRGSTITAKDLEASFPAAASRTSAPATPPPRPPASADGLSLEEDTAGRPPASDIGETGERADGLFPHDRKAPDSTRYESETGFIDVDETKDRWQITNTKTADESRRQGAGTARLVAAAQRAQQAGKPLDSDISVHPDALLMYLKAIKDGKITAEFDQAAVDQAIKNRRQLESGNGVFRNILPVAQEASQAQETATTPDAETSEAEGASEASTAVLESALAKVRQYAPSTLSKKLTAEEKEALKKHTGEPTLKGAIAQIKQGQRTSKPVTADPSATESKPFNFFDAIRTGRGIVKKQEWAGWWNDLSQERAEDLFEAWVDERGVPDAEADAVWDKVNAFGIAEDKRLVEEDETAPAETQEAEATPEEAAPTNPLLQAAKWVSDRFLGAFQVDKEGMEQRLSGMEQPDRVYLNQMTDYLMPHFEQVIDAGLRKFTKDEATMADALDSPWGVAFHAFVKDDNGTLVLHPELKLAFARAAIVHLHRAPTLYTADNVIDEDGNILRAATPHAWARDIARDAMLMLGMKASDDVSETLVQGLPLAIGLGAVQALLNLPPSKITGQTDLILEKTVPPSNLLGDKDLRLWPTHVIKPTLQLHALAAQKDKRAFVRKLTESLTGEKEYGGTLTPSEEVPERISYSGTKTSDSQKRSILNHNRVPHYRNTILAKLVQKAGKDGLLRLLTGGIARNDPDDPMPIQVQQMLTAQAQGIQVQLDAMEYYDELLGADTTQPLYINYTISVNGRTNSKLGPQGYTLLRDLYSSAKTTLDLNDAEQLRALKMTIAQALGIKTDINSPEVVVAEFDKLIEGPLAERAKALVQDLEAGKKIYQHFEKRAHSPREIHGLLTLGQFLLHDAAQPFDVSLAFEIDGKTNGAFNTEMFFGLGTYGYQDTTDNLEQGGLFLDKPDTSWGVQHAIVSSRTKSKDLYDRVAQKAAPLIQAAWAAFKAEWAAEPQIARLADQNKDLLIQAGMFAEKGGFTREASKAASNPIVYGAGLPGIMNQLIKDMKYNLAQSWIENDHALKALDGTETQAERMALRRKKIALEGAMLSSEKSFYFTARAAAEALLTAYQAEKPTVTAVTQLLVKATGFGYALKTAQWRMAHDKALAAFPDNKKQREKDKVKGRKTGTWALSKKQYREISKNTLSMTFGTAANPEGVSLNDTKDAPWQWRAQGLGTDLIANINLPQVPYPGVRVLAVYTQSAGDGAMNNAFFQTYRAVTDVYDGLEFKINEFMKLGKEVNKAVWETATHNAMKDFEKLMRKLDDIAQKMSPEEQQAAVKAWNEVQKRDDTKFLIHESQGDIVVSKPDWPGFYAALTETHQRLFDAAINQAAGLRKLKASSHTMLQMGGGEGYTTPALPLDTETPVREAINTDSLQEGADKMVEAVFTEHNTLDRAGVTTLLDGVEWPTRLQKLVWSRIRKLLPNSLSVTFAKNEEEWNAAVGPHAIQRPYGSVKGSLMSDGRIVMATTNPVIVLHEVMHSVFSGTLSTYFTNINQVPAALRSPINDLVQLLERFKRINSSDLAGAQAVINRLEQAGDVAGAVDEMLTYSMTDSAIIERLSPGLVQRILHRVKQFFWGLLGKDVPGQFLDDAIRAFSRTANALAGVNPTEATFNIREHADPLEILTENAFVAIAHKIARGQGFKVPKAIETHLDKLLGHFSLSTEQQKMYKRVYVLMRMETRPAEAEQFISTALPAHPQANLFNGAKDVVASAMALAAVDPTFKAQLESAFNAKRGQLGRIDQLMEKALSSTQLASVDSMLTDMVSAMAEDAEYNMSALGTLVQKADRLGSSWLSKIGEKAFRATEDKHSIVENIGLGIYALTNEEGADSFGKLVFQAVNEWTNSQALQDLAAAMIGSQSDTNKVYRAVNMMRSMIAQTRSMFTITLPAELKKIFPVGFDGWNRLYHHFGRLDVHVLGASAAEMFLDDAVRRRTITALASQIPNAWDAENLGHYLVHGKVTPDSPHALLRNARAIADDVHGRIHAASAEQVALVDQLVSLYAIEALAPADRAQIAQMFRQYAPAMDNLIGMMQKVAEEDKKQYDHEERYNYWKGSLPLSTDPRTSVVIAGAVKGAQLEGLGYTKKQKYVGGRGDPGSNVLHYYVRKYAPPPAFTQGVLNTVQQTAMGINYATASTITPEVGNRITSSRLVEYLKNNQGRNSSLVPVFGSDGEIIAYERLLDRKFVQEVTNSEGTNLHIAIGMKLGRIMEERLSQVFNDRGVGVMYDQWERGKASGAENQYVAINLSQDKQIKRAWEVIPARTKRTLELTFGGKVMVRKDLLSNTLGYHKAGVLDIFTGDASLNEQTRRALFGAAQHFLGPSAPKVLFIAESAIKEGVATAKDWIIVRSLSVALNNAMASLSLVVANGVPVSEVFKSYREGLNDIRAYARLSREIIELTVKITAATGAEKSRLKTLQDGKREAIKRLAIYPLIEAGELNDLPEGLEETPSHSYLGDMAGWMNNHLRKIHPKTPMYLANAALAKDSEFHNALSKAIQAGDFLGRWAVYKHMVKSGKTPTEARDVVRDEFVSYTTNPGRFRGALEDYGMVWWSQFTIRAQKVLLRRFRRNPLSFFVAQGLSDAAGTDGPFDQSISERGWDNSTGVDNVFNAPSAHIYSKLF